MAITTEATEIVDNYKLFSEAMFADDSPYAKSTAQLREVFEDYGLTTVEHGQVLAQTISQMATSTNSQAMDTASRTVLLSKDVDLKEKQATLVERQARGYDDNLLLKVVEHYSGVTQYAVNAGDADNIQSTIAVLNTKIMQVEERVDNGTYVPEPLPQ